MVKGHGEAAVGLLVPKEEVDIKHKHKVCKCEVKAMGRALQEVRRKVPRSRWSLEAIKQELEAMNEDSLDKRVQAMLKAHDECLQHGIGEVIGMAEALTEQQARRRKRK